MKRVNIHVNLKVRLVRCFLYIPCNTYEMHVKDKIFLLQAVEAHGVARG
jgi:hypothetical protein